MKTVIQEKLKEEWAKRLEAEKPKPTAQAESYFLPGATVSRPVYKKKNG